MQTTCQHIAILKTIASLISELTTTDKNIHLLFEIYIMNITLKGIHPKLMFKSKQSSEIYSEGLFQNRNKQDVHISIQNKSLCLHNICLCRV